MNRPLIKRQLGLVIGLATSCREQAVTASRWQECLLDADIRRPVFRVRKILRQLARLAEQLDSEADMLHFDLSRAADTPVFAGTAEADKTAYNVAADRVINADLSAQGIKVPDNEFAARAANADVSEEKPFLTDDPWESNPDYPLDEWQQQAGDGYTVLNYRDWVIDSYARELTDDRFAARAANNQATPTTTEATNEVTDDE